MMASFRGGVVVAAEAEYQAVVAGFEPGVGVDCGPGGFYQQRLQVLVAFAGLAVLALASRFVVTRAQPGP